MFRSLRVSTDYSIKISFIMDGHTLGVVDFTIAAEDRYLGYLGDLQHSLKEILDPQHRRLSTSTASSGFESRKVSTASSTSSSMSASTFPTEEVDIEEESAVTRVRSDHHLDELINGEMVLWSLSIITCISGLEEFQLCVISIGANWCPVCHRFLNFCI